MEYATYFVTCSTTELCIRSRSRGGAQCAELPCVPYMCRMWWSPRYVQLLSLSKRPAVFTVLFAEIKLWQRHTLPSTAGLGPTVSAPPRGLPQATVQTWLGVSEANSSWHVHETWSIPYSTSCLGHLPDLCLWICWKLRTFDNFEITSAWAPAPGHFHNILFELRIFDLSNVVKWSKVIVNWSILLYLAWESKS